MLRPGARIGVVAPSGRFDPARLDRGLEVLRSWGYEPVPGRHLHAAHGYLAGRDEERLADLEWALQDPGLEAFWAARGGYGLTRLLDRVDWGAARNPAIGFSDLTALLVASWQRAGISGVHGPVLHNLAEVDEASREALRSLLAGERPGERLVGGNLCVLADLCGTPDQLDARGRALLLEDVGEPAYKVDRMLTRLRRAGVFEGVTEVRFGAFLGCPAPEGVELDEVLREGVPAGLPVRLGWPVGHGEENHAFRYGG